LLAVLELARLRVVRILQQVETGSFFLAQTEGADLADARNLSVTSAKASGHAESEANTAPVMEPMMDQSPAETSTPENQAQEPAAVAATDERPAVETNAGPVQDEPESAASDTAQLVPQEDVISAPFPASAERGEEVIDGQTQEEQKTTHE
jgi:hypothetical protein